jgi:hypothetical protein
LSGGRNDRNKASDPINFVSCHRLCLPDRVALNCFHRLAAATLNVLMVLPVNRDSSAGIACSSFATPIPSAHGQGRDAPTAYVGFLLVVAGLAVEAELAPQGKAGDADLRTLVV